MDENNNTNTNPVNNNDQDLELKKLLDQYSNEVNKSPQMEESMTSNFEPQQEPQPEEPEVEPSLGSGFESQIPPKTEEPVIPNLESQTEQPPEMISNQESSFSSGFDSQMPPKTEENNFSYQDEKKFNFFKLLFIVSILLFVGVLVSLFLSLINGQKSEEVIETNNISIVPTETIIPTLVPTVIPTLIPEIAVLPTISPTATPTAVVTEAAKPSPTPILKTYKNTKYKFSFGYPQTWTVKEVLPTGDQLKTDVFYVQVFEPKSVGKKDDYGNYLPIVSIDLISLKKQNLTFDQFLEKEYSDGIRRNITDFTTESGYKYKHNTIVGMLNYDSFLLNMNNSDIVFDIVSRYGSAGEPSMITSGPAKIILDTFKLN